MESKQQAETSMMMRVKTKIDATDLVIREAMLHFEDAYSGFLACQSQISDNFDLQMMDRTGIRQNKIILRTSLKGIMLDFIAKIESYAGFIEDEVLLNTVDYNPSDLDHVTEQEFIAVTNIVATVVTTHQLALGAYGLTAAMILEFNELRTKYLTVTPLPKAGIDERKVATGKIKAFIKQAEGFLVTMDRAVRAYRPTNPTFHNEYFISREVEDPISRGFAAMGTIVDVNGTPIPFVKMSCPTLKIKRKLSINGTFHIKGFIKKPHLITFEQPNFKTVVYEAVFIEGGRIQIDIVMMAR